MVDVYLYRVIGSNSTIFKKYSKVFLLSRIGIINTEGAMWKDQRKFLHDKLRGFGMTYMGGGKKIMESRIMVSPFSPLFSIFPPFASVRVSCYSRIYRFVEKERPLKRVKFHFSARLKRFFADWRRNVARRPTSLPPLECRSATLSAPS